MQIYLVIGGFIVSVLLLGTIFLLLKRQLNNRHLGSASSLATSLRDEKLKSNIILNGIDDGVVLIDDQKNIQLFNPAATKITGWPENEAVGLNVHNVLKPINEKDVVYDEKDNPLSRVFETKTPLRDSNAVLVSREGKRYDVNLSVSPLFDHDNHIAGAVAVFRDVSEEHNEEQRRGEFISTASHEMRTPVAAIEGYLALALNEKVSKIDAKARDYLDKAHASAQHLGKLFQDLLTSAKAEDGRLSSHPIVIEMGAYLEQLTEDLRFGAQKKGLLIEFVIGSNTTNQNAVITTKVIQPLYYIFADSDRLREVITNLFDNAVKYTDTGKVSVGITGNDTIVQVSINDTGPGIAAEDIPHLFQKFYRVDNSATRTIGGTGLGLFICRKIVELYNGRIWVESGVGRGSTFYINFPRLSSQKASELVAAEAANMKPPPIASLTST